MFTLAAKTKTLRTLDVHAVLNSMMFFMILFYMLDTFYLSSFSQVLLLWTMSRATARKEKKTGEIVHRKFTLAAKTKTLRTFDVMLHEIVWCFHDFLLWYCFICSTLLTCQVFPKYYFYELCLGYRKNVIDFWFLNSGFRFLVSKFWF